MQSSNSACCTCIHMYGQICTSSIRQTARKNVPKQSLHTIPSSTLDSTESKKNLREYQNTNHKRTLSSMSYKAALYNDKPPPGYWEDVYVQRASTKLQPWQLATPKKETEPPQGSRPLVHRWSSPSRTYTLPVPSQFGLKQSKRADSKPVPECYHRHKHGLHKIIHTLVTFNTY